MAGRKKKSAASGKQCPKDLCAFLERQTEAIDSLKNHILDTRRDALEREQGLWERAEEYLERFVSHPLSKLGKAVFKSLTYGTVSIASILGGTQLLIYLYKLAEEKAQAQQFINTAEMIYYEENNPAVALGLLEKAEKLHKNEALYNFLHAYIEGMGVVKDIINLDRPLNRDEVDRAHKALALAQFLQDNDPSRPEGDVLKSQIYMALEDKCRALAAINSAEKKDKARQNPFVLLRLASIANQFGSVEENPHDIPKDVEENLRDSLKYIEALQAKEMPFLDLISRNETIQRRASALWAGLTEWDEESQYKFARTQGKWAYLWLGVAYADIRKWKEAIENYEYAINADPNFDLAHANLGKAYMYQSAPEFETTRKELENKARNEFELALAITPDNKDALYGLGMLYGYQDEYETAEKYLTKAIDLSPQFFSAWKWRGIIRTELANIQQGSMNAAKRRESLKGAFEDFERAQKLNPNAFDIHTRRAKAYQQSGNFKEALAELQTASKLSDSQEEVFKLRQRDCPHSVHSNSSEQNAAGKKVRHNIERNLDLKMERVKTKHYLGRTFARMNRHEQAIESLKDAIKTDPTYAEAYYDLIKSKLALNGPESEIARLYEDAAKQATQRQQHAYLELGRYLSERGEYEEALKSLNESLKYDKQFSPAMKEKACLFLRQGKKSESDTAWKNFLAQRLDVKPDANRCLAKK